MGTVLSKCHENYAGCIRLKVRHTKNTGEMAKEGEAKEKKKQWRI